MSRRLKEDSVRIEREKANRMELENFADKHGLVMKICERTRTDLHPQFNYDDMRYYAHFKNVEVLENGVLASDFGNGRTEIEAIADYAFRISGKLLVFGAYTPKRREFWAPEIYVSNVIQRRD